MTRSYCTLSDKNYLYQVLALHNSLLRYAGDFRLYTLCMDYTTYELLVKMHAPTLVPINLDEVLTAESSAVRARTTHGQFCWVCQPLLCQFVLDRFAVAMVTYLEADSLFFSDPEVLFAEMEGKSASLVPHNYSSGLDQTANAGTFCVQFNAFRNDAAGRDVLAFWRSWCFKYNKGAPTAFPGQTSLDDWPKRFDCVAVIRHRGAGVAPWNVLGYRLTVTDSVPHVDGVPVVFYHFHEYGRYANGDHELGRYPLTQTVIDVMYAPYVRELDRAKAMVLGMDPTFTYRRMFRDCPSLKDVVRIFSMQPVRDYVGVIKRKVRGRYHVYPDEYFRTTATRLDRQD